MRLLLLHGPAISNSRLKLQNIKKEFGGSEVVVFEKGVEAVDVLGSLATLPLLSGTRLIVWENAPENFNPTLGILPDDTTLTLWFDHEVESKKPILEFVKKNKGQVFLFEERKETSVFPFLDMLANMDKKAFSELNKLTKLDYDSQYLITMIFYLLRSLIAPNKNSPSFVKQKLQKQRQNFSDADLAKLYKFVLETDFKIKSGLLESTQANFLLVQKFVGN